METLKVSIVQSDIVWENVDENLMLFSQKIGAISNSTDIIILPEMFNTGFSMKSEELAETMKGKTVTWMKEQAKKTNAVIVGSLIIKETSQNSSKEKEKLNSPLEERLNGVNYYNRLIWMQPNGEIHTYDKRHLFRMAREHKHFSAGGKRLIVNYKGWRICPLICYDLRFPVWSRNSSENEIPTYDCLIYIANWPAVRKAPWSKLLEARAIENQCYVVGVNRVGIDGTGKEYSGNSAVVNPKGEVISTISEGSGCSELINLSLNELNNFRAAFPAYLDGDEFGINF